MNAKLLILTLLLTLTSVARAEDDSATEAANDTEAKAAVDCHCTGSQQNNDKVTDEPRETKRDRVKSLTGQGGAASGTDEQGTGTGH